MIPAAADLDLGIDPGFQGALFLVHAATNEAIDWGDMPVYTTPSGKRRIDRYALACWLDIWRHRIRGAVYEEVRSFEGEGVTNAFTFGRGLGVLEGVLAGLGIWAKSVEPAVWKANLALSRDKRLSLSAARLRWPKLAKLFRRVSKQYPDTGRAEAGLLAVYGKILIGALR